jgi:transcriptional/translational regulatory protein YebC/TACO1
VSALSKLEAVATERGLTPARAEPTMVPKTSVHVEEEAAGKVLRLIDALDDNEDVQEVFANFDVDDDVLEKVQASE